MFAAVRRVLGLLRGNPEAQKAEDAGVPQEMVDGWWARWVHLTAADGGGGSPPQNPTATAGSGAHVGLDVNVIGGSVSASPALSAAVASLADVTPTGTPTAFGSLAAGKEGILVSVDPNSSGYARVSGSDVTTTKGQPFGPGASYVFRVANASQLSHVLVSGSPTLCVSAV